MSSLDQLLTNLNTVAVDESAPQWANVLIQCFQGLISVLKVNFTQLNTVNELQSEVSVLRGEIGDLRGEIDQLKLSGDDYEQRSRNDCLVIHGIPEGDGKQHEDTDSVVRDTIEKELGVELKLEDIKRSHRLGPRKNQRATRTTKPNPRRIIFRFQWFNKRQEIYSSKRKLKGKGITITENLTRLRYEVYKQAILKFGKNNVWSMEGRIFVKIDNEKKSLTTLQELESL